MHIYNHEKEEKRFKKERNDYISNTVGIILGIIFFGGCSVYFGLLEVDYKTMGISIGMVVLLLGLLPIHLYKGRKKRVPENIRFQEMRDLVANRQILNLLSFDCDFERLDCIETDFGIEIGYQPNDYAYFNCMIDAKSFGFAIELIDDVYDFEFFDDMVKNDAFNQIDEYVEKEFNSATTKEEIIEEFTKFIQTNQALMTEINVLCAKYQKMEETGREED